MTKEIPQRITYAQEKLIKLIENRDLRKWCLNNNLEHSYIYRLGLGEYFPNYRTIASMSHLIPPIEWLYFTDEKLPFTPICVSNIPLKTPSKYVLEHRKDFNRIAKEYNLSYTTAYNIFVAGRTVPSITLIRQLADKENVNPIEFFTVGNIDTPETYPDRGYIINVDQQNILVLTKKDYNFQTQSVIGCAANQKTSGIKINNKTFHGYFDIKDIKSFDISNSKINVITIIKPEETNQFLQKLCELFN